MEDSPSSDSYVLEKIIQENLAMSLTQKDRKVDPEYMCRYRFTSC